MLLVRLPDRVDRPRGSDVAERGLQTKRDICGLVCWNFGKDPRGQRSGFPHASGNIESPFEARNVRQIRQGLARFKVSEEIGEVGDVLDEATRVRWMPAQIFMRGIGKTPLVDQAAYHWEGALQRGTEYSKGVVAVDSSSRCGIELVLSNGGNDFGGVVAKHGLAELNLQLKQCRFSSRHQRVLAHAAPHPEGFRAREGWCPTRSARAQARSAGAPRHGGSRRVWQLWTRGRRSGY